MYALLICIVVFILCAIWLKLSSWMDELFPFVGCLISGLAVAVLLLSIAASRMDARDFLAQRDTIQRSYDELRSGANPLEMATVAQPIADYNGQLASYQYWNRTQWDWWIPDAVQTTQPIRRRNTIMRFNCGPTRAERAEQRIAAKSKWHRWFAWRPGWTKRRTQPFVLRAHAASG